MKRRERSYSEGIQYSSKLDVILVWFVRVERGWIIETYMNNENCVLGSRMFEAMKVHHRLNIIEVNDSVESTPSYTYIYIFVFNYASIYTVYEWKLF